MFSYVLDMVLTPEALFWLEVSKILAPLLAIGIAIWKCSGWVSSLKQVLDNMENSVNTIETAITRVDLKTMELTLSKILGMATPSTLGKTVHFNLTETRIGVSVSLVIKSTTSEIEIRFDQPIEIEGLHKALVDDQDLRKYEKNMFGKETNVAPYSPRGLRLFIHSDDLDLITTWTKFMLDRIDRHLAKLVDFGKVFDKKLEEKL